MGRGVTVCVGDKYHFRVLGLDGVVEQAVMILVDRSAVLVADFHVLQVEGGRMAGLGPEPAPLAFDRAVGIFDGIQGVLDPGADLSLRTCVLVGYAAVDDEQRLRADVFTELQILVVAQAVGGTVSPQVPVAGPLGQVADAVFQRKALCRRLPST